MSKQETDDRIACTAYYGGRGLVDLVAVSDPSLTYAEAITIARDMFPGASTDECWRGHKAWYFWHGDVGEALLIEMGEL